MPGTNYSYLISSAFPNGKVATDRLVEEIRSSVIIIALEGVSTESSYCYVLFKEALSTGDKEILDGIVAVHSGEPREPVLQVQPVKVVDTEGLDPTKATTCTEFIEVEVEANEPVSEGMISYPFPVDVAAARYVMEDPHYEYGDKFDVFGISAGDPAIGYATGAGSQGDTEVAVSATVFQYSRPGMYLKFQGHADEYRIESMDPVAGTVELMAPLEQGIVAGETAHVRRPFLVNGWVCKNLIYPIGDLTSGSSKLNANDVMRIRYFHKTTPTESYKLPFALAMMF
jgi:hypothetical protein